MGFPPSSGFHRYTWNACMCVALAAGAADAAAADWPGAVLEVTARVSSSARLNPWALCAARFITENIVGDSRRHETGNVRVIDALGGGAGAGARVNRRAFLGAEMASGGRRGGR